MRAFALLSIMAVFLPGFLQAGEVSFEDERFTLEFPATWKKEKGPDDGNVLYHEAPKGEGSFSVFTLKVKKDHRANLEGTLKSRVEALSKSGMKVTGDVEGQEGSVDGKKAIFAVIPVEARFADQVVKFRYYLVLVDAKDTVVIMQATLPSPAPAGLQKTTLGIIQSFKEKEKKDKGTG